MVFPINLWVGLYKLSQYKKSVEMDLPHLPVPLIWTQFYAIDSVPLYSSSGVFSQVSMNSIALLAIFCFLLIGRAMWKEVEIEAFIADGPIIIYFIENPSLFS